HNARLPFQRRPQSCRAQDYAIPGRYRDDQAGDRGLQLAWHRYPRPRDHQPGRSFQPSRPWPHVRRVMKVKIWVLCTVLADENAPAMPAVFVDEAEAWAKY